MNFISTPISGVIIVETNSFRDGRGFFYRAFCRHELDAVLGDRQVLQINISRTETPGTIRGLHFQYPPYAEMKLIRCLRGSVWDLALDLRRDSPTFLQWHAETLSAENGRMIIIPEGCAHGFQVIKSGSELLYLHTASYEASSEGGIRYNDPAIQIPWPIAPLDVSRRDRSHPLLQSSFGGIQI